MRIIGTGSTIPTGGTTSEEIEARLGLEPGWIARRTGIDRRPVAAPDEATSDLAVQAGKTALTQAGISADKIGIVLLATSTPDHLLPPTAPLVAHRLGTRAGAIDLAGACSGFLYGLILGSQWVDGVGRPALVIGANILTRRINPKDPATVALFSDGAGAVVLSPSEPAASTSLLSSFVGSDGSTYGAIGIPAGGTREPLTAESLANGGNLMTMRRGASLFKHAVHGMADAGKEGLKQAGLAASDIDWWIPHQANTRIIQDTGTLLGIPPERTINVVAQYGNSSAATIPIALSDAVHSGKLKAGDKILMTAAGAGLVTAAAVVRW